MRISDWSSDVCSSDLRPSCSSSPDFASGRPLPCRMRCSGAIRCFPAPPRPQPRLILLHQKIDGHRARYGFHQRVWVSDHPAPWAQALSGLALLVMAATLANADLKQLIFRLLDRGPEIGSASCEDRVYTKV